MIQPDRRDLPRDIPLDSVEVISDKVLKLKNFKKDALLKLFKLSNQERYEHVGLKVTSAQGGKDYKMAKRDYAWQYHHRQGCRFGAGGNEHDGRDPRDVEIERLRQRVRDLEIQHEIRQIRKRIRELELQREF
nr:hypothetical protein [Tanacetum cinerariifolium]